MAEEAAGADDTADAAAPAEAARPNRRKLILLALLLLVLLGGGGAGAWFFLSPRHSETAEPEIPESFVDVEPMQVNLRTPDGATRMLKVHFMLVPGDLDEETLKARLPLVIDSYQPFLRELRPEDITGAAATFRLKEEMLVRANQVLGKGAIRDVLIQDLVQQ